MFIKNKKDSVYNTCQYKGIYIENSRVQGFTHSIVLQINENRQDNLSIVVLKLFKSEEEAQATFDKISQALKSEQKFMDISTDSNT